MVILGWILIILGSVILFFGEIRFLLIIYRHGPFWFFSCLILPLIILFFSVIYLRQTWRPISLIVLGVGIDAGGYYLLLRSGVALTELM